MKNNKPSWDIAPKWAMLEILRTYPPDYRVIFVGDASMSPYEIMQPGGSIEHWNDEAGAVWIQRLTQRFKRHAWLNPEPEAHWDHTASIGITRQLLGERMFPLTLEGLDRGIQALKAEARLWRQSPALSGDSTRQRDQPVGRSAFSALMSSSTIFELVSGSTDS